MSGVFGDGKARVAYFLVIENGDEIKVSSKEFLEIQEGEIVNYESPRRDVSFRLIE